LRKLIQFVLNKAGEMRTQDTGLMRRGSRPMVPDDGIFSQCRAERHGLQWLLNVVRGIDWAAVPPYAPV
jgi:hypothetical protein